MKNKLRLIVFFIPVVKTVNGGILSIFSICQVSRQFKDIHNSEVVLATYPGSKSYKKNDLFENNETIYTFDEIVKRGVPASLQLHVPEYASSYVFSRLKKYSEYLQAIPELSINVMNQNILMMEKPAQVADWFMLTSKVTQTTAHDKTASQDLANKFFLPTHHLSVFNDPNQYKRLPYDQKENLIVFSPDMTNKRAAIVTKLKRELHDYTFVTIEDMPYEEYKRVIEKAKFTITFGEGFDGYYIETFFSGGIAFAVYDSAFFPDEAFQQFENVYASYDQMLSKIVGDIMQLDHESGYEKVVERNFNKIAKLYDYSRYVRNIREFYLRHYTYLPEQQSALHLITAILEDRDKAIAEKDQTIRERDKAIAEKDQTIRERDKAIAEKDIIINDRDAMIGELLNSRSWKVTAPLRKVSSAVKRSSDTNH